MKRLRAALGDSAETPRFIETLPRRGYRFLTPVEIVAESDVHDADPVPLAEPSALAVVLPVPAPALTRVVPPLRIAGLSA